MTAPPPPPPLEESLSSLTGTLRTLATALDGKMLIGRRHYTLLLGVWFFNGLVVGLILGGLSR